MDPWETEFLAEKELVSVVPYFTYSAIHLIGGDFGPFRAGLPVQVPIWLALSLRQQQKCRIVAPEWLDAQTIANLQEEEKNNRFFTRMPNEHYMAVANLLLRVAGEDIPNSQEVRTAIKDLWDVRISKLRASVDSFIKSGASHARLDYLTISELNSIRPVFPHALDFISRLQTGAERK